MRCRRGSHEQRVAVQVAGVGDHRQRDVVVTLRASGKHEAAAREAAAARARVARGLVAGHALAAQHRMHRAVEGGARQGCGPLGRAVAGHHVVEVLAAQIHPLGDDAALGGREHRGVVVRRRPGERGARIRAGLEVFTEQDFSQSAGARQPLGAAGHRLHQRRAAHDLAHAVFQARHGLAGGGVDQRVAQHQSSYETTRPSPPMVALRSMGPRRCGTTCRCWRRGRASTGAGCAPGS